MEYELLDRGHANDQFKRGMPKRNDGNLFESRSVFHFSTQILKTIPVWESLFSLYCCFVVFVIVVVVVERRNETTTAKMRHLLRIATTVCRTNNPIMVYIRRMNHIQTFPMECLQQQVNFCEKHCYLLVSLETVYPISSFQDEYQDNDNSSMMSHTATAIGAVKKKKKLPIFLCCSTGNSWFCYGTICIERPFINHSSTFKHNQKIGWFWWNNKTLKKIKTLKFNSVHFFSIFGAKIFLSSFLLKSAFAVNAKRTKFIKFSFIHPTLKKKFLELFSNFF